MFSCKFLRSMLLMKIHFGFNVPFDKSPSLDEREQIRWYAAQIVLAINIEKNQTILSFVYLFSWLYMAILYIWLNPYIYMAIISKRFCACILYIFDYIYIYIWKFWLNPSYKYTSQPTYVLWTKDFEASNLQHRILEQKKMGPLTGSIKHGWFR